MDKISSRLTDRVKRLSGVQDRLIAFGIPAADIRLSLAIADASTTAFDRVMSLRRME